MRWTNGDIIGCAVDLEAGTVWFGCNGNWVAAFEGCGATWGAGGVFPAMSGICLAFALNAKPRFAGPSAQFAYLMTGKEHMQLLDEHSGAVFVSADDIFVGG